MASVSLIVVEPAEVATLPSRIDSWRDALRAAGHVPDVIVVGPRLPEGDDWLRGVSSPGLGHADDASLGLRQAGGEIRLVVDADRAYTGEDVARVVAALDNGGADVAVADGHPQGWRALFATILRPLTRSSDPFSGLIGLTAEAFRKAEPDFRPVGRRFALEILARTRGGKKPADIAVSAARSRDFPAFRVDDFRHIKRLADDTLGNVSRLIQFCVVGASGMVVDLTFYAFFQWVFAKTWDPGSMTLFGAPAPRAVARVLAIAIALTWNFTLNRRLTFSYARKGAIVRQFVTYVLSNALGIALSLTLSLTLPRTVGYFERHTLTAALVGIVAATGISFSMSRWLVFKPRRPHPGPIANEDVAPASTPPPVPEGV